MTDLDKKIQKSQPDLVQSVLEAQDKRNIERVDLLITNALKQLKMSRFKPDQATCLSLIYIARVSPKSFSQSCNLKEILKTHLKRDSGPAAIKNDFVLPVLAANILLACSDTPEVRSIILKKIEGWLSSNQKITENVQHLLTILCVRCQGDAQTVQTLIDLRQHWYHCLNINPSPNSTIAADLCEGIRNLLHDESSCEPLVENLAFLKKHDKDIMGLSKDISKFILKRPITIRHMLDQPEIGKDLKNLLLQIYNKLFEQLKFLNKKIEDVETPLFFRLPTTSQIVATEQCVIEAVLTLLTLIEIDTDDLKKADHGDLFRCWLVDVSHGANAILYTDPDLTNAFHLSTKLRHLLTQSNCDSLVDIGLHLATPAQLIELLQQFGMPQTTISKIFNRLNKLSCEDFNKIEINDPLYFEQLLEFFTEIGVNGVNEFKNGLQGVDTKETKVKPMAEIKVEFS